MTMDWKTNIAFCIAFGFFFATLLEIRSKLYALDRIAKMLQSTGIQHTCPKKGNKMTSRDFSPLEIRDMAKLTGERIDELNQQLSWIEKDWIFPSYVYVIGIIISGFCSLYFSQSFVRIIGIVVMAYSMAQLAHRSGEKEGYYRGYLDGHENGVYKAFGISEDDAAFLDEAAAEIELAERLKIEK